MAKYELVGEKNAEKPTYLVDDTTYALSAAALKADMDAEGVGAPIGTLLVTAGYANMKQLAHDGSWVSL